jgi:hypothetical protein
MLKEELTRERSIAVERHAGGAIQLFVAEIANGLGAEALSLLARSKSAEEELTLAPFNF